VTNCHQNNSISQQHQLSFFQFLYPQLAVMHFISSIDTCLQGSTKGITETEETDLKEKVLWFTSRWNQRDVVLYRCVCL